MGYSDVWSAANDADFQGRCMAGLWDIAQAIVTNAGNGTLTTPTGNRDLTTEDCVNFAMKVLRGEQRITLQQLAVQILRDGTIAADPATSQDGSIQYDIKDRWFDFMAIG